MVGTNLSILESIWKQLYFNACRPYKTLLLSVNDTAVHVVQEMPEKYGINKGILDTSKLQAASLELNYECFS